MLRELTPHVSVIFLHTIIDILQLPEHLFPSFAYPFLQVQVNDPSLLIHVFS